MVDLVEAPPPAIAAPRPSRRRLWVALVVVAVLVAGAAIATTAVSFHYLHAASLSTDGGGWTAPDDVRAHDVEAGPYTASVIAPRPGHRQSFELDLNNFSDVTQTVLGLTNGKGLANPRVTGEPETLQVSTTAAYPEHGTLHFTSAPVTIPPGGQYRLRFTRLTAHDLWSCGRSEYISSLSLRVRVGMFTRTETVDFAGLIMEVRSSRPAC